MGRRTLLLIAAIIVAAVGTTLVFLYAQSADQRALGDQKLVKVLVAVQQVSQGTKVTDAQTAGAFQVRDVAANSRAQDALTDTSSVAELVALAPIFPGQQLVRPMFGQASTTSQLPIPAGKMGISVQLSDPARVADFVSPGSDVAVFVTLTSTSGSDSGQQQTRILLPRVTVIAVGATTTIPVTTQTNGQQQTEQVPKTILTLALDQTEAQKLVFASQSGQLYFGLLTKDSQVSEIPGTTSGNLFGSQ